MSTATATPIAAAAATDIHQLDLRLRAVEGAVVRALGLIERRGFRLLACEVADACEDGQARFQAMSVRVRSDRPAELLKRQLERLYDVLQVEMKQPGVTHHA
ncbi:ACT domain-containing protein [Marinihelvus fidelis]|nr:ACT domain-containing protein [Marinihelvus fidelis]